MAVKKVKKRTQSPEPDFSGIASESSTSVEENVVEKAVKRAKKTAKRHSGKNYTKMDKLVDKSAQYILSDAIELAKKTSYTKFEPAIEIHLNLNTDPKNSAHTIRTTVNLPHSTGKKTQLIAFGGDSDKTAITKAGAIIGTEELIEELAKGKINIEGKATAIESGAFKLIATAEWMPKLAKVAKILGPKGLMPNPKSGTVTANMTETLGNFKGGMIEIKTQEGQAVLHTVVGKKSSESANLEENVKTLVSVIQEHKPANFKKQLLKSVFISATMGPGIKIDLASLDRTPTQ